MTPEISQHRTDISIFDLDRTITRRGTWSAFLLFAAWNRAPWRLVLVPAVLAAMLGYKAGLCSRTRLKEMMHHLMIGKTIARAEINALANRFCMRMLETNIYPEAIALIDREIAAGRRVMIASASSRFYLAPLARALGVKDEIGTRSKWTGELLTPRIEGENCFGQNKRAMMIERFGKLGLERAAVHIRFYSDDISDRPAFDWADEPVAVNPSPALARLATLSGWPILDWRQKERWTKTAARVPVWAEPLPSRSASRAE